MLENKQSEFFKTIANRLVGNWYNMEGEGGFVFSLCDAEGEPATVHIIKDGQSEISVYTLYLDSHDMPVIIVFNFANEAQLFIKVLVKDTLILQSDKSKLHILERKPDLAFADALVAGL